MQLFPTLTPFSSGYYLVEDVLLQPTSDLDTPRVHECFYELLQDHYYGDEPTPMLFKYPGSAFYFDVVPGDDLPTDVLEVPDGVYETFEIEDDHTSTELLMATPEHAQRIYSLNELAARLAG